MALLSRHFLDRRRLPRIVIAGANFAGLAAARGLPASRFRVTVIDPAPKAEWLPNIHELLSRRKTPDQLQHDRHQILQRLGHEFLQEAVTAIEPVTKRVMTSGGGVIDYDELILAVGSTAQPPVDADPSITFTTKSVADCQRINHALTRLAALPGNRTVAIVGGGIEGLEMLGEILRRFGGDNRLTPHLIEARPQLFERFPGLHDHLMQRMGGEVSLHCGLRVHAIGPQGITLENGEMIEARLILWTAGSHGHPLLADAGLCQPGQHAPVNNHLQSLAHPDIFIIGDAAQLADPLGKQAYHAQAMGHHVANLLKRREQGRELPVFQPHHKPSLVSFGDRDAFMIIGNRLLASPSLLGLKEAIYQYGYHDMLPPRSRREVARLLQDVRQGVDTLDAWRLLAGSAETRLFEAR